LARYIYKPRQGGICDAQAGWLAGWLEKYCVAVAWQVYMAVSLLWSSSVFFNLAVLPPPGACTGGKPIRVGTLLLHLYLISGPGMHSHDISPEAGHQVLFVYGFLLLSNMVPFSSQIFLSALYVFILVTG